MKSETEEMVDCAIQCIRDEIQTLSMRLAFIMTHRDKFVQLGVPPSGYSNKVDLDNLSRDKVVEAIKLFPGTYQKSPNDGRMDYTMQTPTGIEFRYCDRRGKGRIVDLDAKRHGKSRRAFSFW